MNPRFGVGRLLALFRKPRLDRELGGEILAHLEMAEHDALAAGLWPEEARRDARRRFGRIERMKEDHRDQRSIRWVENLVRTYPLIGANGLSSRVVALDCGPPRSLAYLIAPAVLYLSR